MNSKLEPEICIKAESLTNYEMRMLGEAFDLCGFTNVFLNGEKVNLQDMVTENNTWEKAWDKFDTVQTQQKQDYR